MTSASKETCQASNFAAHAHVRSLPARVWALVRIEDGVLDTPVERVALILVSAMRLESVWIPSRKNCHRKSVPFGSGCSRDLLERHSSPCPIIFGLDTCQETCRKWAPNSVPP